MNTKIRKTKQALFDALCGLLKTHALNDITVAELCRQASLNRTTFYKYYAVPMDVLTEHMDASIRQMLSHVKQDINLQSKQDLYELMLSTCQSCLAMKQVLYGFLMASGDFVKLLTGELMKLQKQDSLKSSRIHFISGGVSAVLVQWVLQGYPSTPESTAALLAEYIHKLL